MSTERTTITPCGSCHGSCDAPAAPVVECSFRAGDTVTLHIAGMDCPTEEALISSKLAGIAGLSGLSFNLVQRTLTLTPPPGGLPPILQALQDIGLAATPLSEEKPAQAVPESQEPWWPLALSGITALAAEAVEWLGGNHWLVLALALVAIGTGGLSTYKKGWIALRHRNLNMNALMSIAVTGALVIGHWPEAAMVMFLFALAELIEAKSLDRARHAIRQLMDLSPETATVQTAEGQWQEVAAKVVQVGQLVRLRPGERVALDGVVTEGRSTINQAPITGESVPVDKQPGDPVFAGTINDAGELVFQVNAEATHSTLARIINAVEAAQGSRAPTQRFVDQFARIYTPAVFAVALLMAVLPPLLWAAPWYPWIYKSLVLLVIACPCALVISTPVTIVSGLAAAARHGILIKGGAYLEAGRHLRWLALDKTGTLTHGKPAETDFLPQPGWTADQARQLAVSLASRSDHPVSRALAQADASTKVTPLPVTDFKALPGKGVQGRLDGRLFSLGNQRLVAELGGLTPELAATLETLERQGKTAVLLADGATVVAVFGVADTVKASSREAIQELHDLGVRTVMLSGDNQPTAQTIARQVGIDEACGGLLPEDKLQAIKALQDTHGHVGMVGDGINDAPALAQASVGFAMGAAGSDTAIETADVALMDDDLRKIPGFIRLSRHTAAILTQNIVLALGIKAVFLALTFTGQATMWMAVFADMGASLLVVGNGLRLLRHP